MKKILYKTSFFVIPFFFIFILFALFFSINEGDLYRVGYLFKNNSYQKETLFKNLSLNKKCFKSISETNLNQNKVFDFLCIGDSFSEMGNDGYKNYIACNYNKSLIHVNRFIFDNPIEGLYTLCNSDFFDKNKPKYVILQNVERGIIDRVIYLNKKNTISLDSLTQYVNFRLKNHDLKKEKAITDYFFSRDIIRFFMYNITYNIDDNAFGSEVFKVKTTKSLFTADKDELLFLKEDLDALERNNDKIKINLLNDVLNDLSLRLKKRNIELIVIVSPDKYDLHYDYIMGKEKYVKPIFFKTFSTLKKDYTYIDAKKVLANALKNEKDIYYYDDSHWSPKASILIANEVLNKTFKK